MDGCRGDFFCGENRCVEDISEGGRVDGGVLAVEEVQQQDCVGCVGVVGLISVLQQQRGGWRFTEILCGVCCC